ncbi:hypothetical protein [Streptomyces sp. NPDC003863]
MSGARCRAAVREAFVQPGLEAVGLPLHELSVVEGVGQGRHALAEGQDVHREVVGLDGEAELLEPHPEPRTEQVEDGDRLGPRGMTSSASSSVRVPTGQPKFWMSAPSVMTISANRRTRSAGPCSSRSHSASIARVLLGRASWRLA